MSRQRLNRSRASGGCLGIYRACVLVLAAGACGIGFGCGRTVMELDSGAVYPEELGQAAVLDVRVVRDEAYLRWTNTAPYAFGPTTVWVNGEFSSRVEGIGVGQTVELPLESFRNEHGEVFRGGGFFATRRPKRVVLVQLQPDAPGPSGLPDGLIGLVVVDRPLR